jgi:hypothetical protein
MKAKEKAKRMTVREIRQRLELQIEMDKKAMEQLRGIMPCLDVLRAVEVARARMHFCNDLLKEMSVNKKGK